jgi:class 3 adenylate cyclase
MTNLRATVVMKTDVRDSTPRIRSLGEEDLSAMLRHHTQLMLDYVGRHGGQRVKGEGDGFWLIFPSVTSAALAAVAIQRELRVTQVGKDDSHRLAVRMAITLGDVLHQEADIFGETVNLAARIEGVTPADSIYLSAAAWLALNKAEVQTTYVDEFQLKGFTEAHKLYRVEYLHQTQIIPNQIVVFTDLRGFGQFDLTDLNLMEQMLVQLHAIHSQTVEACGGTIRLIMGPDAFLITFDQATSAMEAVERLLREWEAFRQTHAGVLPLKAAVGKATIYLFRSHLFGPDLNAINHLDNQARRVFDASGALITAAVQQDHAGTPWAARLQPVEGLDYPAPVYKLTD